MKKPEYPDGVVFSSCHNYPVMTGARRLSMQVAVSFGARTVAVPRQKLRPTIPTTTNNYTLKTSLSPEAEVSLEHILSGGRAEITDELRTALAELGFESMSTLQSQVTSLKQRTQANQLALEKIKIELATLRSQTAKLGNYETELQKRELRISEEIESTAFYARQELSVLKTEIMDLRGQAVGRGRSVSLSRSMPDITEDDAPQGVEFPFKGNPFNGIIAHLTDEFGGNVVEQEVVNVTARDGSGMKYIVELEDPESNYCSKNIADGWFCLDFLKRSVIVTNYTFRTYAFGGKNYFHPKSWVVEVSTDEKNWTTIDQRVDNQDLNGESRVKTFPVAKDRIQKCRYVRVRSTGPNHNGKNHLVCSGFEVFGFLCESK